MDFGPFSNIDINPIFTFCAAILVPTLFYFPLRVPSLPVSIDLIVELPSMLRINYDGMA